MSGSRYATASQPRPRSVRRPRLHCGRELCDAVDHPHPSHLVSIDPDVEGGEDFEALAAARRLIDVVCDDQDGEHARPDDCQERLREHARVGEVVPRDDRAAVNRPAEWGRRLRRNVPRLSVASARLFRGESPAVGLARLSSCERLGKIVATWANAAARCGTDRSARRGRRAPWKDAGWSGNPWSRRRDSEARRCSLPRRSDPGGVSGVHRGNSRGADSRESAAICSSKQVTFSCRAAPVSSIPRRSGSTSTSTRLARLSSARISLRRTSISSSRCDVLFSVCRVSSSCVAAAAHRLNGLLELEHCRHLLRNALDQVSSFVRCLTGTILESWELDQRQLGFFERPDAGRSVELRGMLLFCSPPAPRDGCESRLAFKSRCTQAAWTSPIRALSRLSRFVSSIEVIRPLFERRPYSPRFAVSGLNLVDSSGVVVVEVRESAVKRAAWSLISAFVLASASTCVIQFPGFTAAASFVEASALITTPSADRTPRCLTPGCFWRFRGPSTRGSFLAASFLVVDDRTEQVRAQPPR